MQYESNKITETKHVQDICIDRTSNNKIIYFDILNIIACIAVLYLHCNGAVHSFSNTQLWKECLIIEVLCYFAVPLFIMLSGATLLTYRQRYTTKQYFIKRFKKILIPWVIWSLITYIVNNRNLNLLNFAGNFIDEKIEPIYWFFPLIMYIYCLIPVFSILVQKEEHKKVLWSIVIFIFVIQSVLQPIFSMFHKTFPAVLKYMTGQNAYIIYVLLGYLLSINDLTKKQKYLIYIFAIMSLLTRYLYTMNMSIKTGELNKDSWGYTAFTAVFPTIAIFILIKSVNCNKVLKKLDIKPKYISNMASYSFGIYLIHMLIKNGITCFFNINIETYFYRLIFPLILYIVCMGIVYIVKKIPILKKIVP